MDTPFNLSKTDSSTPVLFDLTKAIKDAGTPMPTKLRFGAGWDPQEPAIDVDLSVGVIDAAGKLVAQSEFAFFGQPEVAGIELGGDDLTGSSSDGEDDETAIIDFAGLAENGVGVIGSLSVYNDPKGRTLKDAGTCYIRLVNEDTNEEILRVSMDNADSDAMNVIKVSNVDGNMIVEAIEIPVSGDANSVCESLA